MYETVDNTAGAKTTVPPHAQLKFDELAGMIEARSLIVWEEHCSECAYPNCYTSCAFYAPRRDLHCRRFADGIEQETVGNLTLGKIRFGKWAKLEGAGPVDLFSMQGAARREWLDRLVSPMIVNLAPSGPLYARSKKYWNRFKAKSFIGSQPGRCDGFVVEAFLAPGTPLPLTITFLPAGGDSGELFQSRVDLQAGYNRILLPHSDLAARVDLKRRFLIQIEPVGDAIGREVTFGLIDFVRFAAASNVPVPHSRSIDKAAGIESPKSEHRARIAKCVVWDLDDTIWHGTLAEDGHESLTLDPTAIATVIELDRRGILQSIATKNDPEAALAALGAFNIRDYFLFPQIGWGPKSAAVKRIAELLDIGLDTFVFVDDQPFERGEVGETLPEVTVLPHTDIPHLLTSPLFDVPATPESARRRAMYQTEELRQATFTDSDTDYVTFLRACRIRLEISSLAGPQEERAYELSQRTNQLNVSGKKYSRDDIQALTKPSSKYQTYMLRCEDRFGDYGLIGMCVLDRRSGRVHSFMMSCRVQRKRVEQSFFAWLARQLDSDRAAAAMTVNYERTQRNQAIVKMLDELGFAYHPEGARGGTFVRPLGMPIAEDDVVEIVDLSAERPRVLSS